jgi:hypothetical protein
LLAIGLPVAALVIADLVYNLSYPNGAPADVNAMASAMSSLPGVLAISALSIALTALGAAIASLIYSYAISETPRQSPPA